MHEKLLKMSISCNHWGKEQLTDKVPCLTQFHIYHWGKSFSLRIFEHQIRRLLVAEKQYVIHCNALCLTCTNLIDSSIMTVKRTWRRFLSSDYVSVIYHAITRTWHQLHNTTQATSHYKHCGHRETISVKWCFYKWSIFNYCISI